MNCYRFTSPTYTPCKWKLQNIIRYFLIYYLLRINHLLLADPWGFTALPPEIENGQYVSPSGRTIPWWFFILFKIYNFFNPLALFRVGGRYTLSLIKNRRRDICEPFNILWEKEEDNVSADYLHQANLHTPRWEQCLKIGGSDKYSIHLL